MVVEPPPNIEDSQQVEAKAVLPGGEGERDASMVVATPPNIEDSQVEPTAMIPGGDGSDGADPTIPPMIEVDEDAGKAASGSAGGGSKSLEETPV